MVHFPDFAILGAGISEGQTPYFRERPVFEDMCDNGPLGPALRGGELCNTRRGGDQRGPQLARRPQRGRRHACTLYPILCVTPRCPDPGPTSEPADDRRAVGAWSRGTRGGGRTRRRRGGEGNSGEHAPAILKLQFWIPLPFPYCAHHLSQRIQLR